MDKTTIYEMLYPTIDSVATDKVILMKKDGVLYLLSTSSSLFDIDYSSNSTTVDIKTSNGARTIQLKKEITEKSDYLTPINKNKRFPVCFIIPPENVPSNGFLQIRSKGTIYSFDLDKE